MGTRLDDTKIIDATVPIFLIDGHSDNYNIHPEDQIDELAASHHAFGQYRRVLLWAQPNGRYVQVTGHGFKQGAMRDGRTSLRAEVLPISTDPLVIKALMAADNLHMQGSYPDAKMLVDLLQEQKEAGFDLDALGTSEGSLQALIDSLNDAGLSDDIERPGKALRPNKRKLPFDLIYTWGNPDSSCCMAVQAGLKYGVQSGNHVCANTDQWGERHKIVFIDNDYAAYDHAVHLAMVKKYRPKYATVKDIMTRSQCREANIAYASLEQVLKWAEELEEYAENIIVIPKYDCISVLPDRYMLGYSLPTSHGGTPLSTDVFRGRRVHLLGGSWIHQLNYLADLGEDVVSVDNNHVNHIAKFGGYYDQEGERANLTELALEYVNNPQFVALALSFGSMGAKINELYGPPLEDVEVHKDDL